MVGESIARVLKIAARDLRSGAVVQWGARRHGSDGIYGNRGNVVSVTYRF